MSLEASQQVVYKRFNIFNTKLSRGTHCFGTLWYNRFNRRLLIARWIYVNR
jgi:hypothetical protein